MRTLPFVSSVACAALLLSVSPTVNAHGGGGGGWHGGGGAGWHGGGGSGWHGGGGGHWHGGGGHWHGGSHWHGGVFIGVPLYPEPYWPSPWYYNYPYPAVVTVPASPPVYVEQPQQDSASSPDGWWYYCRNAKAYYPTVTQCPQGWEKVPPQAPPPQ